MCCRRLFANLAIGIAIAPISLDNVHRSKDDNHLYDVQIYVMCKAPRHFFLSFIHSFIVSLHKISPKTLGIIQPPSVVAYFFFLLK